MKTRNEAGLLKVSGVMLLLLILLAILAVISVAIGRRGIFCFGDPSCCFFRG